MDERQQNEILLQQKRTKYIYVYVITRYTHAHFVKMLLNKICVTKIAQGTYWGSI